MKPKDKPARRFINVNNVYRTLPRGSPSRSVFLEISTNPGSTRWGTNGGRQTVENPENIQGRD